MRLPHLRTTEKVPSMEQLPFPALTSFIPLVITAVEFGQAAVRGLKVPGRFPHGSAVVRVSPIISYISDRTSRTYAPDMWIEDHSVHTIALLAFISQCVCARTFETTTSLRFNDEVRSSRRVAR
ncbi:hypothetical protein L226DRAFT_528900 [Lentinus tigrinus ALCF2SS1-7]|uniref:uncharacterized protein n=1 Tax=Lentinus tigrinus ALCF2SS1-7 TaxID=1328758 RepID=UPI001166278E|nr:hypothetical protein L226DRAFT_528900 [Lentinus tigrinus ALCF2SS1-7]